MSAKQTVYTLNNGSKGVEEGRLATQHNVFLQTTKTLIPDTIAAHLSSLGRQPAIADVGTGTGIWLQSLSQLLSPAARLDGYDFDISKFPEATQLSSNIQLSFGDVFKPFPAEVLGIYDVVHVRLLMFAIKDEQWESVAANLRTLLRPGGLLMWDELGYTTWQCLPMTESFMKWISTDVRYAASVGRDITSPLYLRSHMQRAGFTKCTQQTFSTFGEPLELQKQAGNALASAASQSLHGILAGGGFEWVQSSEEIDELIVALRADIDNGKTQVGFSIYWIIGQNPEK